MRRSLIALALFALLGCEEGGRAAREPDGGDASPRDAGALDVGGGELAPSDAGAPDATGGEAARCSDPRPLGPGRVLFVGNSFTFTADMPRTFQRLVAASGFPAPDVEMRAVGGKTLEWHRADTSIEGAPNRVGEGWDVVVLQELSTRPTDALGAPARFEADATYFHDLAIEAEPSATVVLYETFARAAGHPYYPRTFADPADMQAQLRFYYDDCAERYIPLHTSVVMERPVAVARVGDAWERALGEDAPPRLHAEDDYHPNATGAYLTALVFFGTIYERSTLGLPGLGLDPALARELQRVADETTGARELAPAIACPRALPIDDAIAIDLGPLPAPGWAQLAAVRAEVGPLVSVSGVSTDARASSASFGGTQSGGSAANTLALPADVSRDSLWVGSFDGHEAALSLEAHVTLTGLVEGSYDLELFASRDGTDAGRGRLTRYRVRGREADLDVADNRSRVARFEGVTPDASGELQIDVGVSPAGTARFGYLGAIRLTRRR